MDSGLSILENRYDSIRFDTKRLNHSIAHSINHLPENSGGGAREGETVEPYMHAAECSLVNGKPACSIPHVQPRVARDHPSNSQTSKTQLSGLQGEMARLSTRSVADPHCTYLLSGKAGIRKRKIGPLL